MGRPMNVVLLTLICYFTEKLRFKASHEQGEKAVKGWGGNLAISNRPREQQNSF